MRVDCSLKAKVIYIGLNTSDEVRKELKEYAKSNGLDIYEMGIERGANIHLFEKFYCNRFWSSY